MRFGSGSISPTHPAIQISTQYELILNIHSRTLSEPHTHFQGAAPPPPT